MLKTSTPFKAEAQLSEMCGGHVSNLFSLNVTQTPNYLKIKQAGSLTMMGSYEFHGKMLANIYDSIKNSDFIINRETLSVQEFNKFKNWKCKLKDYKSKNKI